MRGYAFSLRPDPTLDYAHIMTRMRIQDPRSRACVCLLICDRLRFFNRSRNRFQNRFRFRFDDRSRKPRLHYIMNNTRREYFCRIWRSIQG